MKNQDIKQVQKKFPRYCSKTGEGMFEGFCFGDGLLHFKHEAHALEHAKSLGYKNLEESYNDGAHYWSEWSEDDIEEEDTRIFSATMMSDFAYMIAQEAMAAAFEGKKNIEGKSLEEFIAEKLKEESGDL